MAETRQLFIIHKHVNYNHPPTTKNLSGNYEKRIRHVTENKNIFNIPIYLYINALSLKRVPLKY